MVYKQVINCKRQMILFYVVKLGLHLFHLSIRFMRYRPLNIKRLNGNLNIIGGEVNGRCKAAVIAWGIVFKGKN